MVVHRTGHTDYIAGRDRWWRKPSYHFIVWLGALVGGGNKEKTPFPYGFIPVIL